MKDGLEMECLFKMLNFSSRLDDIKEKVMDIFMTFMYVSLIRRILLLPDGSTN